MHDYRDADYCIRRLRELVKCPECGGDMRLIPTKAGDWFFGCIRWPECKGTRSMPGKRSETISRRRREFVERMDRQPSAAKRYSERSGR